MLFSRCVIGERLGKVEGWEGGRETGKERGRRKEGGREGKEGKSRRVGGGGRKGKGRKQLISQCVSMERA